MKHIKIISRKLYTDTIRSIFHSNSITSTKPIISIIIFQDIFFFQNYVILVTTPYNPNPYLPRRNFFFPPSSGSPNSRIRSNPRRGWAINFSLKVATFRRPIMYIIKFASPSNPS